MSQCIALIRGINVGRANRIAMADRRDLIADLGQTNGRTLLNSGNLLFRSKGSSVVKIGACIEAAITAKCGFSAAVMVMTAQDLDRIVAENPLLHAVKDHAKHLVAFVAHPKYIEPLRPILKESSKPDAIAITERAAYL